MCQSIRDSKNFILSSDADVIKGQKEVPPHLANKKTEVEKASDSQAADDHICHKNMNIY